MKLIIIALCIFNCIDAFAQLRIPQLSPAAHYLYKDEYNDNPFYARNKVNGDGNVIELFTLDSFTSHSVSYTTFSGFNFLSGQFSDVGRLYNSNLYLFQDNFTNLATKNIRLGLNISRFNRNSYLSKVFQTNLIFTDTFKLRDYSVCHLDVAKDELWMVMNSYNSGYIGLLQTDLELNLIRNKFFVLNNHFYNVQEIRNSGDHIYLLLNGFEPEYGQNLLQTVLLKFDLSLNLVKGISIDGLHSLQFDFGTDDFLVIRGREDLNDNFIYLMLDRDFNYKDEISFKSPGILKNKPSLHTIESHQNIVNSEDEIFLQLIFNSITLIAKVDKNFSLIWQKIIPENISLWPDSEGGASINITNENRRALEDKLFSLDATSFSNPLLLDYCGNYFARSTIFKNRIMPFDEIKLIDTAVIYEEEPFAYTIDSGNIDAVGMVTKYELPKADFEIGDFCSNQCDTIIVKDRGVFDTSFTKINGIQNDNIFCPESVGIYEVKREIIYFGSCVDSLVKTIEIFESPEYYVPDSTLICDEINGQEISVQTDSINEVYWLDNGFIDNTLGVDKAGNYKFRISNEHCIAFDSISVASISDIYSDWPEILEDKIVEKCEFDKIEINVRPDFPGNYLWPDGTSGMTYNSNDTGYIRLEGSYHGCIAIDSIYVLNKECRSAAIFVPNIFSPNNDYNNDFLNVNVALIEVKEFYVFDRWGSLMYQSKPYDNIGWDGKLNNFDMPPGVYIWMAKCKNLISGESRIYKGDTTLIR